MKVYRKQYTQLIPADLDTVWDYFSRPQNLQQLTAGIMDFKIITPPALISTTYAGQLIAYKVTPFPGLRLNWLTEITHYVPKQYFIDEQRFGPYSLWHHQHHFIPQANGVLMKDILHYAMGYRPFGPVINKLLVGPKINHIFSHRAAIITQIFGKA